MEKVAKYKGMVIWKGKDCEGKKCYHVSRPGVEPSTIQPSYSLKAAREFITWVLDVVAESGM